MTAKRGLPLNERADFIEISRRAGKASAIARAKKKERAQKIAEAEAALFQLSPSEAELAPVFRYIENRRRLEQVCREAGLSPPWNRAQEARTPPGRCPRPSAPPRKPQRARRRAPRRPSGGLLLTFPR